MRRRRGSALVAVGTAGLLLSGCGGEDGAGRATATEAGTTITVTTEGPTTSTTAPSATTVVPPGPGRCTSAGLGVEARVGGASAGHRHDVVVFTNTGAAPCTLRGYPGVSYLDAGGAPAGAPAQRLDDDPPVVSLEPGERAHASLNQGNAMVGTPECGAPVDGVTLQVFPPEETVAKLIPYRSTLCSGAAILHVGVIHPGTEQAAGENAGA